MCIYVSVYSKTSLNRPSIRPTFDGSYSYRRIYTKSKTHRLTCAHTHTHINTYTDSHTHSHTQTLTNTQTHTHRLADVHTQSDAHM